MATYIGTLTAVYHLCTIICSVKLSSRILSKLLTIYNLTLHWEYKLLTHFILFSQYYLT